jgi:hypothetical protein
MRRVPWERGRPARFFLPQERAGPPAVPGPALPGRIVAVGTTLLRLLESAVREDGAVAPFSGDTSLFITPGYGPHGGGWG